MNSLRIARTALRARPAAIKAPLQRRGYAEAVSDKVGNAEQILRTLLTFPQIKLSLALPHQVRSKLDQGGIGSRRSRKRQKGRDCVLEGAGVG